MTLAVPCSSLAAIAIVGSAQQCLPQHCLTENQPADRIVAAVSLTNDHANGLEVDHQGLLANEDGRGVWNGHLQQQGWAGGWMDAAGPGCACEAQLLTCGSSTLRSLYGMDSWWVMMCLSPCRREAHPLRVA